MKFNFSSRKALFILVLMLVALAGGSIVSSKWQANLFKSLDRNTLEATVAPESFYFDDSQDQLQQSFSQISELEQDEVPPIEPVLEDETESSGSETPLTMAEIQEVLDDIAEKVDVITEEVNKLALNDTEEPDNPEDSDQDSDDDSDSRRDSLANLVGGGGTSAVYPKILISEVQIDLNQRFIELYNSNPTEIDLTGWYIQRKTKTGDSWGSLVSSTYFEGKSISALGYFLISRTAMNGTDILLTGLTLTADNAIVLKNPNGDISDKIGWGQALDYEGTAAVEPISGKSLGRKWVNNTEQDTDNNLADFEVQPPTPKAQNNQVPLPNPFPDTNNDSKINVLDLILIRNHLGSKQGDPNWDSLFDMNNDGIVNRKDLEYVRNNLNKQKPSAPQFDDSKINTPQAGNAAEETISGNEPEITPPTEIPAESPEVEAPAPETEDQPEEPEAAAVAETNATVEPAPETSVNNARESNVSPE